MFIYLAGKELFVKLAVFIESERVTKVVVAVRTHSILPTVYARLATI